MRSTEATSIPLLQRRSGARRNLLGASVWDSGGFLGLRVCELHGWCTSWGMQRRTGGSRSLALEKTEETEVEFSLGQAPGEIRFGSVLPKNILSMTELLDLQ